MNCAVREDLANSVSILVRDKHLVDGVRHGNVRAREFCGRRGPAFVARDPAIGSSQVFSLPCDGDQGGKGAGVVEESLASRGCFNVTLSKESGRSREFDRSGFDGGRRMKIAECLPGAGDFVGSLEDQDRVLLGERDPALYFKTLKTRLCLEF